MGREVNEIHEEGDWGYGRTTLDDLVYMDGSVDGDGGSIRDKPVWDADFIAYYLNRGDGIITDSDGVEYESGAIWGGAAGDVNRWYTPAQSFTNPDGGPLETLTFGFYNTRDDIDPAYDNLGGRLDGFSAFDEDQRAASRQAISTWDDLVAISFVETAPAGADINLMNTTTGPIQASAFLPYSYGPNYEGIQGDIAVNPNQSSNHLFDEGQYGLTTLIHELGHSLGLEHPGAYNFGPGFDVTYENGAEYYQDSAQYTIMSYWDGEETGASYVDWATLTYRYASTPGVHDVLAIQRLYGADMTTRTDDTTYGFNNTTGLDTFDFELTPQPVLTIWDAGGNDTLDLSGFATSSFINLNDGEHSSAGGIYSEAPPTLEEINARRAEQGLPPRTQEIYDLYLDLFGFQNNGLMKDNISIAYGATIENAVGGSGNDTIVANEVVNVLDGGTGFDMVSYQDSTTAITASLNGGVRGAAAGDQYTRIEGIQGSAFADRLNGVSRNETLLGGGGNDRIDGMAGNDLLGGGAGDDIVYGGTGADSITGNEGVDTLYGGDSFDRINAGAGNDYLLGENGNDNLFGGAGMDFLHGGHGNDQLFGATENDYLNGFTGDDTLNGGAGSDELVGFNGADSLNGGAGNDILEGGAHIDTFVFTDVGTDRIMDHQRGEMIDLTGLVGATEENTEISGGFIHVDLNADGFPNEGDLIILSSGAPILTSEVLFAG